MWRGVFPYLLTATCALAADLPAPVTDADFVPVDRALEPILDH